jgi:feruloyl esterase
MRIDYGYRGTHAVALAAKSLSAAYYGAPLANAYFNGCSNGGRQALMEAQRFPKDFDGVIAGDPSFGTAGYLRRTIQYQAILSSAEHWLPPAKVELLARTTLAACDARDGLKDGLIGEPQACNFKPETLKCAGADRPDCLTEGQIKTAQLLYSPTPTPTGVVPGFPPQSDGTIALSNSPPAGYAFQDGYLRFLAFEAHNPNFDWRTFDADQHGDGIRK